MRRKFCSGFAALGFMLMAWLLAATPAKADNVEEQIKALEQELAELKSQQIELKKEATAAAAALPTFSYRPGNGLNIEAADKSWGIRFSMESHLWWIFEAGQDQVGRTNGEIMLRRWRPEFYYCIDNCLYEIDTRIDLDGFGTGNVEGGTLQRGAVNFHLENLNPFLPTINIGGDVSALPFGRARRGSSATAAQINYDLTTRNVGPNTGRAGWGISFIFDDRSLSGIGIPGRIGRYQASMASISEGNDNTSSLTDRKDFGQYISIFPFSETKNKWIRGIMFEFAAWFCNVDQRQQADNGCNRFRLRDNGPAARQTLFDTGSNTIGEGLFTGLSPGFEWTVGPYRLRLQGSFFQAHDGNFSPPGAVSKRGKKRAHEWLIGHDLYLWSPKGFLTGSPNTPGSVLVGTHFERNDISCDIPRCNPSINGGQFHRGTYLVREWDLWYFLAPRMSIGGALLWYDASNLTTTVQKNLGINKNGSPGAGGDWLDGMLMFRYSF